MGAVGGGTTREEGRLAGGSHVLQFHLVRARKRDGRDPKKNSDDRKGDSERIRKEELIQSLVD